jgi:uncharacterized membrane protein YhaH (DUF805 family)
VNRQAGSVMDVARSLLDVRGRLSRRGFWMVYAGVGVYSMLVTLPLVLLFQSGAPAAVAVAAAVVNAPVFYVLGLAIIRRLHDRGRAGAFAAAYLIIPVAIIISLMAPSAFAVSVALIVLAQVVLLWGVIELLLLRGQAGPNRFGPDPLALEEQ